jgi:hypothetical protein
MKFLGFEGQEVRVNLDYVSYYAPDEAPIHKQDEGKPFAIYFNFNCGSKSFWAFETKEERDYALLVLDKKWNN